ncbi:sigma-54 interaction domain-containing protein [Cobetia crustatorum]|uniref:sigma-54 interaction domain-containing protein n=1 Tax=Cobetia crustatorum TaxID=553385 RepID=UPI0004AE28B5|nr:sigma 54-interacting transcriptional regulator [Cobetia crustatorum]
MAQQMPVSDTAGGSGRVMPVSNDAPATSIHVERGRRELLKAAMNAVEEWVVVVDARGCIQFLNAPYAEFLGVDPEAVLGRDAREVIENTRMHEVLESGRAELAQLQLIRGHHMIAHRYPILRDGEVIGVIGSVIYHDTWEWRQVNAQVQALEAEVDYYRQALETTTGARWKLSDIIGESAAMRELAARVRKIAPGGASVLIRGESGTGKELYAHSLHRASARAEGPFIKLNCAAIPEALLEAELFGYEEGAFTGARRGGKPGKFQLADGGTLFLDEVGDMPLAMQAKLLRVLQDREVEAVGATRLVTVDVRVIAATHRPLEALVESGEFREDLFYRINVVPLVIPPLRERREDLPGLAAHLLERLARRSGRRPPVLSPAALERLCAHHWPGNVRELENVLEAAFYLGGSHIQPTDLPDAIGTRRSEISTPPLDSAAHCTSAITLDTPVTTGPLREAMAHAEHQLIEKALCACGGNRTQAARQLGIAKSSLYEKLARHGL